MVDESFPEKMSRLNDSLEGLLYRPEYTAGYNCHMTPPGREFLREQVEVAKAEVRTPDQFIIERDHPMMLLGEGNQRMVFTESASADGEYIVGGDCVVKLSKFPDAWQNENEIRNWVAAPEGLRQYLFPVVDWHDEAYWLLMPRAERVGNRDEAERIESEIESLGYAIPDIRPDHVGLLDGEWRLFDHGYQITDPEGRSVFS